MYVGMGRGGGIEIWEPENKKWHWGGGGEGGRGGNE